MSSQSEIWLWRKYEMPVLACDEALPGPEKLRLWQCDDGGQLKHLMRWGKLRSAFAGFVSRGPEGGCHATAYWLSQTVPILLKDFQREFNDAVDLVDFCEIAVQACTGLWAGDQTPYFVTDRPDFAQCLRESYQKTNSF